MFKGTNWVPGPTESNREWKKKKILRKTMNREMIGLILFLLIVWFFGCLK